MKHVVIAFGGLVSSFFFACSSAAPPQDPGIQAPNVPTTDCDVTQQNGYGVCYPTSDIGTNTRSGTVAGDRIADFAFTGYPGDAALGLTSTAESKTIRLGDYYDPQQKGFATVINGVPIKLIHVVVSAVWCGPCNEETDFITGANYTGANTGPASFAKELAPLGVVFVQALDQGAVEGGPAATLTDLQGWITRHSNDITSMVDPDDTNLGIFFDAAAIPWNATIDARSMEILDSGVGFDTSLDTTIKTWLTWVGNNPAKQ